MQRISVYKLKLHFALARLQITNTACTPLRQQKCEGGGRLLRWRPPGVWPRWPGERDAALDASRLRSCDS
eukprot:6208564-Pleurochrysis_carterae.AAC.1